jgi:hypothetical protein
MTPFAPRVFGCAATFGGRVMANVLGCLVLFASSLGTLCVSGALVYGVATGDAPRNAVVGALAICLAVSGVVTFVKLLED